MYYNHERVFLQGSIFHFPTHKIKGDCAGNIKKICATQVKTYLACIVLERGFEVCRPMHTLQASVGAWIQHMSNLKRAWSTEQDQARQLKLHSRKLGLLAMLSQ